MNTSSQYYFDLPDEEREFIILELGSLYVLNLLVVAYESEEGGLGHPLYHTHECLQPIITSLLSKDLIKIVPYDDGEEYHPTDNAKEFLEEVVKQTGRYKQQSVEGIEQVKKAFYLAMDSGKLERIDESLRPWYQSIVRFDFYEDLAPNEQSPKSKSSAFPTATQSTDSAIRINKKPDHFVTKIYLYKKHTFLSLGVTFFILFIAKIFSLNFFYFFALIAAIWAIYCITMKTSAGSDGLTHKTLFGSTHIDITDIQEFAYKHEDHKAVSLEVIGNKGSSITISPWVDDFNGLKQYLETIKDDQVQS